MPRRFNIVDVFTDTPLAGNQLAVFTDARGLSDETMQSLAAEIGFSETTFVLPPEEGGHARVRIFTPELELPFAGHPVLGTAFVLGGPLQAVLLKLETGRGIVPVLLEREGGRIVRGVMSQPLPTVEPYEGFPELLAALGVERSELPVELYDNGVGHVFVALRSAEEVAAVTPDPRGLCGRGFVCANVFAAEGARVKTRVFCPEAGVTEDPATGSAAGPLAVHLARHGVVEWGADIEVSQGAEIGRPSTLFARAEGSAEGGATAVEVGGSAVVVARGEFEI